MLVSGILLYSKVIQYIHTHTHTHTAKSLQLCPTLCNPIDGSPPGSAVPGILQARTLEWVAISFSNVWKWKVKVKSLSRVQLLATQWTAAYQALRSMGFSRQEYWSGLPLPSPIYTHTHIYIFFFIFFSIIVYYKWFVFEIWISSIRLKTCLAAQRTVHFLWNNSAYCCFHPLCSDFQVSFPLFPHSWLWGLDFRVGDEASLWFSSIS